MIDSTNPRSMADNIRKLWDKFSKIAGDLLPSRSTATTGQILKLTGETKTPAWADEYSYTPPAYSTTETATGEKWIDGKDIYRTVVSGTVDADGNLSISLSSYDIGKIINMYGSMETTNSRCYVVNYYGNSSTRFSPVYDYINKEIGFSPANSTAGNIAYVIVEYTKPDPVPGDAKGPEVVGATPEELKELEAEEKKTTKKKTTK